MKRFLTIATITLGLTVVIASGCAKKSTPPNASGDAAISAESGTPQTTCPVMGEKVGKDLYVDVQGKRIYVCCQTCVEAVKKDPAKYIAKLKEQGVTIEDAPE
jgi:YHS domain-containing protein